MAAQTRQGVREAPAVELRGVSCRTADGSLILDDVNLRVRPGECVLLCGRSGMGKTTVTKCINGLIPQFEPGIERIGDVEVRGLDPAACEMYELARRVGSVFQNPKSQFFNLTSNDELAFGLEAAGEDADVIERRIGETVTALHAERLLGRSVTKMSGGEKQMVLVARALAQEAKLLVMDEPTANLDYHNQVKILTAIKHLAAQGFGILMTSHYPDHAFLACSKVALMAGGHIVAFCAPDDVVTSESLTSLYETPVHVVRANMGGISIKTCIPLLDEAYFQRASEQEIAPNTKEGTL